MVTIGDEVAYLEFGDLRPDGSVIASLVGQGLRAATAIDFHEDHGSIAGLTTFFAHLESHWRGWDGVETWESLEGEFQLRATHSGSHVHLDAQIRNYFLRDTREWTARLEVVVDPGEQLTRAVADMRDAFAANERRT